MGIHFGRTSAVILTLLRVFRIASSYVIAVAKHEPMGDVSTIGVDATIATNVDSYLNIALTSSAEGAEMVVYPEWGLFGENSTAVTTRSNIDPFCENIREPWLEGGAMSGLASVARQTGIIVVANVCDRIPCSEGNACSRYGDGQFLYNSEVDRNAFVLVHHQPSSFAGPWDSLSLLRHSTRLRLAPMAPCSQSTTSAIHGSLTKRATTCLPSRLKNLPR
jgi:hypothetical protein